MRTRITIEQLPLRPRQLAASEVSAVFGGCHNFGDQCNENSDCCTLLLCQGYVADKNIMVCA
jgi:hypothetical protein